MTIPMPVLAALLQVDDEPDADGFWENVATNLTARRLRLLFIADEIPDPLEQVVKFLNEQMPRIEVLAVEIKQFRGESSQTLVPRVIGRTAASSTRGPAGRSQKLTRESFLEELPSDRVREAADRLFKVAVENGAILAWGASSVSIRASCAVGTHDLITVAWLCVREARRWLHTRDFTFGAVVFGDDLLEELRATLDRWAEQFSNDPFSEESGSGEGIKAWIVGYDDAARHIDLLEGPAGQGALGVEGRCEGRGLTPRPPLHHVERGSVCSSPLRRKPESSGKVLDLRPAPQ